jgi:hypothetical protein
VINFLRGFQLNSFARKFVSFNVILDTEVNFLFLLIDHVLFGVNKLVELIFDLCAFILLLDLVFFELFFDAVQSLLLLVVEVVLPLRHEIFGILILLIFELLQLVLVLGLERLDLSEKLHLRYLSQLRSGQLGAEVVLLALALLLVVAEHLDELCHLEVR